MQQSYGYEQKVSQERILSGGDDGTKLWRKKSKFIC